MKSWRRLCFLVLAVPLISGGQPSTTDPPRNEESADAGPAPTWTPPPLPESLNDTDSNSTHATLTAPYSPSHELENATDVTSTVNMTRTGSTPAPTAASASTGGTEGKATVPMTTASSSQTPGETENSDNSSWGYVIIALICIAIIALCVILFFLRRASRMYSFDLQFPDPITNHFNGPTGTFEPVYLDDLAPNDQEATSEPPVTNGTSPQSEEKGSNGENAPQEQTHANGLETSSLSCSTSPTAGDDPADMISDSPSSANLFFDDTGETQQNENNNNPSVCSSDPFVEINLDEPEWCDQLLDSSEATSSVLPFSPFSFSTSS
ncbi:serine-rich adhesin for platelets [Paralichthys olivaceus]|uniref:serine-rich adhesin for platelets n=1 Tax=Paralichthys olivaceus TaxID=8255 RepID=UPI003752CC23